MNGATPIETSFSYPGALLCCPHNMGQFTTTGRAGLCLYQVPRVYAEGVRKGEGILEGYI